MTSSPRKPIWTRERCAAEYSRRAGRLAFDGVRLGWALAVRAHLHTQALRAFANLGRSRPVGVTEEWPSWVEEGLGTLRSAFEAYRAIDAGWGLLVERPAIARDLGLLDGSTPSIEVVESAAVADVVTKAKRELDLSRGARAKDEEARAFFTGVSMRRPSVTAAELNLLAIAVGLEPPPRVLDPGRRRWVDRAERWALSRADRDALAGLAAVDLLLDEGPAGAGDGWLALLGVSDGRILRSDVLGP